MNGYRTLLGSVAANKPYPFLVVALALASAAVFPATAQSVAPQAAGETAAPKTDDPKICRSEGRSGTHLSKKRCMLKAQWIALSRKDYFSTQERRFQQGFTTNPQATPF